MQTQIQWLGHSTFLITSPNGKRILIDPWVQGNPACPEGAKQLPGVDIMLITHGHSDHCADAVQIAKTYQSRPSPASTRCTSTLRDTGYRRCSR